MKAWLFAILLLLLPGCDVATVAILMSGQDSSSDDSGGTTGPPVFGAVSRIWLANIPDSLTAAQQQSIIAGNNGVPTDPWKLLASDVLTTTAVFDPDESSPEVGNYNAILIQTSADMAFNLDSIEILDPNDEVIEYASGTTYFDLVNSQTEILGPPDGIPAVTAATSTRLAFIFTVYSQFIDRFRINANGTTQPVASGDIKAIGDYPNVLATRAGGLAIDAGTGYIHATISVGDTARLVRFDQTAARLPNNPPGVVNDVEISNDLATVGSHSVALNASGVVFTSASVGSGVIQVRRFEISNLVAGGVAGFTSTFGSDRVEHNSIAVDGSGNVIVVGGFNSLLSGRNHWRVKIPDTVTGTPIWQSSTSLDASSTTYWHAVTTFGNDVYATGDLLSGLLGGTNQVYTSRFQPAAPRNSDADNAFPPGETGADVGHGIAIDAQGNIYVCGSAQTAAEAMNGILIRYQPGIMGGIKTDYAGVPGAALNDEFLDVAVDDATGAIYVVGYETTAGAQGENMIVRKYVAVNNSALNFVWEKKHHGGFGNDRAVSCAIFGNSLVVAGTEAANGGLTRFVLRIYEK